MRIFFLCVVLFSANLLYAQRNGEITGILVDSENKPIDKATVSIVSEQDSIVMSYALTTDKGRFSLAKIPTQQDLLLHISHINISPVVNRINLKPNEKLNLDTIRAEGIAIDEVVIAYQAPIRLNGDSLEYKADYFKTRPNATVEELLKLLPGLQVNVDGTIIYEGREVSGIRVNNKDFFIQDLTMATRNLDASLVDVVQVIKDKGESKREILDDTNLPIVINLKTKKEFLKANFGKFYGSGGTRDRYESGALVNTFRDTLQISFIGYGNNLGRRGFDYSEMREHGGLGRAENNSFSSMSYGGLQNNVSLGINTNYDIGKILKTNLMYSYDRQDDYVDNWGNATSFYDEIEEISNNWNNSHYQNQTHRIRAFIRYHIDSTWMMSFDANTNLTRGINESENFTNRVRGDETPVQDGNNESNTNNRNNSYNHNFRLEKKFSASKMVLTASSSLNTSIGNNRNINTSLNHYYLFENSIIDQSIIRTTNTDNTRINNSLNLQIPLVEKFNVDVYTRYNWERIKNLEGILDRQNTAEYTDRGNIANNKFGDFDYLYYGATLNGQLFKKLRLTLGLRRLDLFRQYHFYDRADDLSDHNSYWQPNISLNYDGITVGYSKEAQLPSFYQIVAVDSDLYPTSRTFASPYFENQEATTWRLGYFKFFNKIKTNLNFNINYTKNNNSIAQEQTYDPENSFSQNVNYQAPGTERLYSYGNISKTFFQNKTWNMRVSSNMNASFSNSYRRINGEDNKGKSIWSSWSNNIDLSYKNTITFTPTYGLNINSTKNNIQSENFRDIKNVMHNLGASLRLENVRKFRLETSYTLRNQPQSLQNDRVNRHIVNASLYYPTLKDRGELKLTAFDILNQNQNIYVGGFGNNNFYQETITLRQYFMLGLVYKFLNTPTK